jgi:hypothetical protein
VTSKTIKLRVIGFWETIIAGWLRPKPLVALLIIFALLSMITMTGSGAWWLQPPEEPADNVPLPPPIVFQDASVGDATVEYDWYVSGTGRYLSLTLEGKGGDYAWAVIRIRNLAQTAYLVKVEPDDIPRGLIVKFMVSEQQPLSSTFLRRLTGEEIVSIHVYVYFTPGTPEGQYRILFAHDEREISIV